MNKVEMICDLLWLQIRRDKISPESIEYLCLKIFVGRFSTIVNGLINLQKDCRREI